MTNDMTKGSPIKLIIQFMIPVCLGNIFQQFYNIADSIIAGQFLGVDALAAIGSTGSLIFFVTGWLNGLTSGFSIWVAQWFGAKKLDRMRHFIAMSIYICVFFVVIMTAGLLIANESILRLMNSPENLMEDISSYLAIIYAGLVVTCAYNALASVLRALGDSKSPLYFLIISAVINVGLDVAFIVVFHMGVEGCAYATVIAQGISAFLCLIYIMKKFDVLRLKKEDFEFSFLTIKRLLTLGVPMGLQFSITAIGTIIVQGAINVYGAVYMAGFSAAGKIQNIICTVFVSFGATIATYVGQNRGTGRMDRVKKGVHITQAMILISSVVLMAVVYLFGKYMILIFVDPTETGVIQAAETYFRTVAWCYPFLGSIFLYRNALQGLGYGLVPMLGGIFELGARALIVFLVAGSASFAGVCMSDPAAWIAALIPLIPYYFWVMKKINNKRMNGLMFKMNDDPRIIGSGADGRKHGVGWFIRKTSIDEFPQFWNVLKGDMSLVGTRPPTIDEWEQYENHHRVRMATKPGLTGLWQVSGRNNITDFEEVVKLDLEYIQNWTIELDIKILFKTILVVLAGEGSK